MLYTHPTQALRLARFPLLILLMMATLVAVTGCANRDMENMQVNAAESTLLNADLAEADVTAVREFNEASETVKAARLNIEEKEWDEALYYGQLGEAQASVSLYRAETAHANQRFNDVVMAPLN